MKKFVALLVTLVVGGFLSAQTSTTTPATPNPAPNTPAAPAKATPTTTTTPAKPGAKPDAKKTEPEAKIDGFVIQRKNGTFLGLTIVDGKFRLKFYDKKKKPLALDVDRALARWPNKQGQGDNRTILNPIDPNTLQGTTFVHGPYVFQLHLTLLKNQEDKDTNAETYVVMYSGG
ncbi:MAG TPA: hypothetical protein VFJ90_03935 [Candidatus Didemnitutus sp.]|nr:hypothetical protein [Candidatus Didemnitutus sp.]